MQKGTITMDIFLLMVLVQSWQKGLLTSPRR